MAASLICYSCGHDTELTRDNELNVFKCVDPVECGSRLMTKTLETDPAVLRRKQVLIDEDSFDQSLERYRIHRES